MVQLAPSPYDRAVKNVMISMQDAEWKIEKSQWSKLDPGTNKFVNEGVGGVWLSPREYVCYTSSSTHVAWRVFVFSDNKTFIWFEFENGTASISRVPTRQNIAPHILSYSGTRTEEWNGDRPSDF